MPGMSVAFVQEKRLRAVQRRKEKVEEKEMKSVLISIQPKWCELIANGKKTIEVRKTRTKIETPFKCYIYCTKDKRLVCKFDKGEDCYGDVLEKPLYVHSHCWINDHIVDGKIIGEFVCDRTYEIKNLGGSFMIGNDIALTNRTARESCLEFPDLRAYLKDKNGYAWHISKLKIYDKPKELVEFRKCDIYCGDCKHIVLPTDRLSLSDCDRRCDKFNKDLLFYDSFNRCEECLELNTITRPPQSWCYVEE